MPLYEVMYIIQPDLDGDDLEAAISKVSDIMEKEGEIVSLKKMGKKKLAYEINDIKEGSYVLVNVQAGSGLAPALDHFFKVNEGYLRYIIIRLEESKKAAQGEIPEVKEAVEAVEAVEVVEAVEAPESVEEVEAVEVKEAPESVQIPVPEEEVKDDSKEE
jgi:small subunit ribosomal protein S6